MTSERDVREVLDGNMTPTMKFAYLEHTQDRLKELFDVLKISKNQYVYMMNLTTEEAKNLIKKHPDAFRLKKYKDDQKNLE